MGLRLSLSLLVVGSALAWSLPDAASAQAVEGMAGTIRIDVVLPGAPDGGGGLIFDADLKFTAPLNFTPGSVTFGGQPVDFSGTEASFLAPTYSGTAHFPVTAGPATVPIIIDVNGSPGSAIEGPFTFKLDPVNLGPSFGANNLDIQPGGANSAGAVIPWSSPVVPELNGAKVIIGGPVQVNPIAPDAFDWSSDPNEKIFADPDVVFGDPRGNGCVPGPGDSIFGSPGSAAPIPGGVACTNTSATVEDTNSDGLIELECRADRDFGVLPGTPAEVVIDVSGSWNSPDVIDTNAVFWVEVDPGFPPLQVPQGFPPSNGGAFSGNAIAPPQPAVSAGNTLRVQGNLTFQGPPGFQADVNFPISIDGQVFPLVPTPLFESWHGLAAAGLSLLLVAVWATRRRALQSRL